MLWQLQDLDYGCIQNQSTPKGTREDKDLTREHATFSGFNDWNLRGN